MRHRRKFNHLSRKTAHRRQMLANMASSLILHKRIHTTLAKAKALRSYVEPLITKSKSDNTHSRRIVFSYLQDKEAVTELFRDVSVKVAERPGGYTRIIKTGTRLGDNAEMCMMELVDYNENLLGTAESDKGKSSRRRRGRGGKKTASQQPAAKKESPSKVKDATPEEVEETKDIAEKALVEEAKAEEVVETVEDTAETVEEEKVEKEEKKEKQPVESKKTEEEPAVEDKKEEPKAEVKAEEEPTETTEKKEEPKAEANKEEKKDEEEASDSDNDKK